MENKLAQQRQHSYDADGHLIRTQQSPGGVVMRTASATYTLTGQPATSTDANGNVTRFAYDLVDRLASTTDAEGRMTSYAYDALSRRTQVFNKAIQAGRCCSRGIRRMGARRAVPFKENP